MDEKELIKELIKVKHKGEFIDKELMKELRKVKEQDREFVDVIRTIARTAQTRRLSDLLGIYFEVFTLEEDDDNQEESNDKEM